MKNSDVAPWKILSFAFGINVLSALIAYFFYWAGWLSPRDGLSVYQLSFYAVLIRVMYTIVWSVPTVLLSLVLFGKEYTFSPLPESNALRRWVNRHPKISVIVMVILYNEIWLHMIKDFVK